MSQSTLNLIQARGVTSEITLGSSGLPPEIQWMPPGRHTILAHKGKEEIRLEVNVDAAVAARMQAVLEQNLVKAAAGNGDKPYFDFNHEDGAASGHPTEIYWAGDDPRQGGIRAKLTWSEPGGQAITGRAFRRFSPSFFVNGAGEIASAPVNMGGLVNRAAFQTIDPIWSRQAGSDSANHNPQRTDKMTDEEKQLLTGLQQQVAGLQSELTAIKAKAASPDPKVIVLETQVATLTEANKAQAGREAEAIVAKAVSEGKIPPQDTNLIASWKNLILVDAKNAELLDKLPVNAALARITQANGATTTSTGSLAAEQFVTLVHAKAGTGKRPTSENIQAAIQEKPELYQAWREANGRPGL